MESLQDRTSRVYRITYETFSKFSNNLNRCKSLEEVSQVSVRFLKYLLNFHLFRISVNQADSYLVYCQCNSKGHFELIQRENLLPYEVKILDDNIPVRTENIPSELNEKITANILESPALWCWTFKKMDVDFTVSLVADENKAFDVGDIEILKLISDSFQAKFQEIYLKEEVFHKNQSLLQALDVIKNQNKKINQIVENQKQTIADRTKEVVEKNEKLLHISALNAHNVREPLSRIQGIVQLFEVFDDKTCREDLLPKLKQSSEEMDQVLREVIEMATTELNQLKAKEL
ncbi:histidine kinase [Salegentibacter sp. LM13S]|uniref:histidine kinase n=1 Tax=Salegentibacter lacus TaxID=2873599 RepID=UPI001CCB7175|nr:histidine kinase [Salegentibacter lacus]MBZ9630250.1 histidine kinase [Salegentibacter lacus]